MYIWRGVFGGNIEIIWNKSKKIALNMLYLLYVFIHTNVGPVKKLKDQ